MWFINQRLKWFSHVARPTLTYIQFVTFNIKYLIAKKIILERNLTDFLSNNFNLNTNIYVGIDIV